MTTTPELPVTGIDVHPKACGEWEITSQTALTDEQAQSITFRADPAKVFLGAFVEVHDPDGVRIGHVASASYHHHSLTPPFAVVAIELR